MLIHAYLRASHERITVNFGGRLLNFAPNKNGHVIVDVADQELAEALLETAPDAFRAYGLADEFMPAVSNFILTPSDGSPIDLGLLTDEQVREFAVAQGLPKPHHTKKGDSLRTLVAEQLKSEVA